MCGKKLLFVVFGLLAAMGLHAQTKFSNPVYGSDFPDPSVVRAQDGNFYTYATGQRGLRSADLMSWTRLSNVIARPTWNDTTYVDGEGNKKTDSYSFWACDVSYVDGKYHMFYACALWGNGSRTGIGSAQGTDPTKFTDKGRLFRSTEIGVTNSIDPCYVEEKDQKYIVWGSFHGIYLAELTDDGFSLKNPKALTKLAGGAFEGAMIYKRKNYYYLFASVGSCCDGENSTYRTVVGRATSLKGPYVNKQGGKMVDNNYTTIISGDDRWKGPGHNSEIVTDDNGDDWVLYHSYDKNNGYSGRLLLLDKVTWDVAGWPSVNDGHPSSGEMPGPVFYTGDGADKTFLFQNMDLGRSEWKGWNATVSGAERAASGAGTAFCPLGYVRNGGKFNIYQTRASLPNGLYELKMNEFDTGEGVEIYLNDLATPAHDSQQTATPPSTESATSLSFLRDNFERSAYGLVTDGKLTIGVRSRDSLAADERFYMGNLRVIFRDKNETAMTAVLDGYNAKKEALVATGSAFCQSLLTDFNTTWQKAGSTSDATQRYTYLLSLRSTLERMQASIGVYDSLRTEIARTEADIAVGKQDGCKTEKAEALLADAKTALAEQTLSDAEVLTLIGKIKDALHEMNYSFQKGTGTADDPYIISRPQHLMNMAAVMTRGVVTYFAMENDVDMSGYDWLQLNTSDVRYGNWVNFDGRGHVIRHLKPVGTSGYPSFFGVLCGECRNVGFVDAEVMSTVSGCGVVCGYMGNTSYKDANGELLPVIVENVYVTGRLQGKGYVGVIGGVINGSPSYIRNVYTAVEVTGAGSSGNYCGGIVGRVRSALTMENCYAAGPVSAPTAAAIAAGGQSSTTPASVYTNVIAWNKTIDGTVDAVPFAVTAEGDQLTNTYIYGGMLVNGQPVEGQTHAALQQVAAAWGSPWHADATAGNGYPILEWQFQRGDYREICGFEKPDGILAPTTSLRPAAVYDLSGRRVEHPSRGLYIVNGKKVLY